MSAAAVIWLLIVSPSDSRGSTFVLERFTEERACLIAAAPQLLEAAQAAWNCIAELSPTQARVEVAQMLQEAIAAAGGAQQ